MRARAHTLFKRPPLRSLPTEKKPSQPQIIAIINEQTLNEQTINEQTTYKQVMKKAFDEGWGGVICKTLSLDAKKVVNVTPRYAKLRDGSGAVFGWENIELISDR